MCLFDLFTSKGLENHQNVLQLCEFINSVMPHNMQVETSLSEMKLAERKYQNQFKIIYPRGIGPTYELYSSSRRSAAVPLLKKYMQFFFGYFSGLGKIASPSSNEHGSWRASNIRLFD